MAIDIAIWLFQIQSGKGGTNPALRTFYYRLVRLLSLNIHPIFVFDGPNKPKMKRNKRVGGPGIKVSSIPEFLAKQLLKHFGFPMHHAPGEAEAECALLQKEGLVDAVLSEDVDTLMFGSGMTLRSWTPEKSKSGKTPTHVNVYNAKTTKETSGLDREGMVLVAMMSGGDYIPEGIPGCGPKLACEAAKAGFGKDLCSLNKADKEGIKEWREKLKYEIRTNESSFFKQKRSALTIPDEFPNMDVLGYYTHPAISGPDKLQKLRDTLKWDVPIDFPSLRDFAKDAFDWRCIGGAKQFVRKLAPAILTRELRLLGEAADHRADDLEAQEACESILVKAVQGKRNHSSTDGELELRISFVPINLITIDLSLEEPDEELPVDDSESDGELRPALEEDEDGCPTSPKKKRGPAAYDPTAPTKEWILATFVKMGAPLKVQDYESHFNNPKKFAARNAPKTSKSFSMVGQQTNDIQSGALDKFTVKRKPGISRKQQNRTPPVDEIDLSEVNELVKKQKKATFVKTKQPDIRNFSRVTKSGVNRSMVQKSGELEELDLSAINTLARDRSVLLAKNPTTYQSLSCLQDAEASIKEPQQTKMSAKRRSPDPASPYPCRATSPPRKLMKQPDIIDLLSSSPVRSKVAKEAQASPPQPRQDSNSARDCTIPHVQFLTSPLPDTVTRRKKKSPLKRNRTAPVAGEDLDVDVHESLRVTRSTTPVPRGTVEAMDLASPVFNGLESPGSRSSLPSPSMLWKDQARPTTKAMTAAEIRPGQRDGKPPDTITEWIRRSESVTPSRARFVDTLKSVKSFEPAIAEDVIIDIQSSLPTPPTEIELDEADAHFAQKMSPVANRQRCDSNTERAHISVGALLPSARHLRYRPSSGIKAVHITGSDEYIVAPMREFKDDLFHAKEIPTGHNGKQKTKEKQKMYIQPRESLPGAWKYVEEVNLNSGQETSAYRKAFRMSEVEILDLTED